MKLFQRLGAGFPALLALFLVLTTSCSSDDLLDQVPEDVNMAMIIDLDRALERTGITLDKSGLAVSGDLGVFCREIPEEVQDVLFAIRESVDLSQIVTFTKADFSDPTSFDGIYLLARVKDENKLIGILTEEVKLKEKTIDGYRMFFQPASYNPAIFVLHGGNVWVVPGNKPEVAAKRLTAVLKQAKEKPLTTRKEIVKALRDDKIVSYAFNLDSYISLFDASVADYMKLASDSIAVSDPVSAIKAAFDKIRGCWYVASYDIDGTSIDFDMTIFGADGKEFSYPYVKDVDTSLLGYIPSDYFAVGIMGVDGSQSKEGLAILGQLADAYLSGDGLGRSKKILGWLGNIDGSCVVGFGTDNMCDMLYGGEISNLKVTVAIQMLPGKALETIGEIATMINAACAAADESGSNPLMTVKNGEAVLAIPDMPLKFYFKSVGNDLVISTRPVTTGNKYPGADKFKGHQSGIALTLKSFSDLTAGQCDFGWNLYGEQTGGKFDSSLTLTGCDTDIINGYYKLGTALFKGYQAFRASHPVKKIPDDMVIYDADEVDTLPVLEY